MTTGFDRLVEDVAPVSRRWEGRRVLIVSPYFPPSTLAGVHRARILAKYLQAAGWLPTLLCVDERFHEEKLDPELGASVPPSVEVIRCGAIPAAVSRPFGVGDLSLRALGSLKKAAEGILATQRIDAILITMGPYYTSALAGSLKRRFGVPVVLDFQDPWISDWGQSLPLLSKGGVSHALASLGEPRAIRWADAITAVSERMCADLSRRYRAFPPDRLRAIPIGADADDFRRISARESGGRATGGKSEILVSYVGTYLPRSEPIVRVLFRAVRALLDKEPGLRTRLKIRFVGTSNQPDGRGGRRVWPVVEAECLEDVVEEEPNRVPYFDAIRLLASSNVLLALGSTEPHYTASKIFPVLLSRRPTLAIFHEASSVCDTVRAAGGARLVSFSSEAELEAKRGEIEATLRDLLADRPICTSVDLTALASDLGPGIASRFAEVLEQVVRSGPSERWW